MVTDKPEYWTRQDGDVICRQLGYTRSEFRATSGLRHGLRQVGVRCNVRSESRATSDQSHGLRLVRVTDDLK